MLFLLPLLHTILIDTECLEKLGRILRQIFASIALVTGKARLTSLSFGSLSVPHIMSVSFYS